jgi:hypothetical protein
MIDLSSAKGGKATHTHTQQLFVSYRKFTERLHHFLIFLQLLFVNRDMVIVIVVHGLVDRNGSVRGSSRNSSSSERRCHGPIKSPTHGSIDRWSTVGCVGVVVVVVAELRVGVAAALGGPSA